MDNGKPSGRIELLGKGKLTDATIGYVTLGPKGEIGVVFDGSIVRQLDEQAITVIVSCIHDYLMRAKGLR